MNVKCGRPIPPTFATYESTAFKPGSRDHLGYPGHWQAYHCEQSVAGCPSLMDSFWSAATPVACEHDVITRRFIRDRVIAKLGR